MIIRGQESRNRLLKGMDITTDVVKSTLGYRGRNVIIQDRFKLGHHITKDGVTVANSVVLEDDIEAMGSEIIKASANRTLKEVGDNTTTSCILTYNMCRYVDRELALGETPTNIIGKLKRDCEKVLKYIEDKSIELNDMSDIYSIAYVSSNNNSEIAEVIYNVYKEAGKSVAIDVRPSDNVETTFDILKGYTIEQTGYSNPFYINNFDKGTVEYADPDIYVFNGKIRYLNADLLKILDRNSNPNDPSFRPIVIICEDIEDSPESIIIEALKLGKAHNICIVKTNLIYEDRKNSLIDVCHVTDAGYSDEEYGVMSNPGGCSKIVIEKDKVVFINGNGDTEDYLKGLKKELKKKNNIFLEKRIMSLESSAAIINVGGYLSTEVSEKVDRIDDAVRAVKSSLEEGYVPGGSSVFIFAEKELDLESYVVKKTLLECYKQLMSNAGLDPMYYLREIHDKGYGYSYNLQNNQVSDMISDGIIDSAKGLRISFENAISTAINFSNIDSLIC